MADDRIKDAVREVRVPSRLEGATDEEIFNWAKEELDGVEPDLKHNEIQEIKRGSRHKVTLRPSKPGFFLPDGTFVEAYDYDVALGEELGEVESAIEDEQQIQEWVDQETAKFNKDTVDEHNVVREMWKHGKRMDEFMERYETTPWNLHNKLDSIRLPKAYSLRTHQISTRLYEWKPEVDEEHVIFSWTWQLVDAVLKFSPNEQIRERLVDLVEELRTDHSVSMRSIAEFLRGPGQSDSALWNVNETELRPLYDRLLEGNSLEPKAVADLGRALTKDRES